MKNTTVVIENVEKGQHVEITPKKSVRLYGTRSKWNRKTGNMEDVSYDITFNIGDMAEYNAYNLKYVGRIVSIGKCVTIEEDNGHELGGATRHRLSVHEFNWRNIDFDLNKINEYNSDMMMSI